MTTDLKVPITIYFPYELAQKITEDCKKTTGGDRSQHTVEIVLDGYEARRGPVKATPSP